MPLNNTLLFPKFEILSVRVMPAFAHEYFPSFGEAGLGRVGR